MHVFLRTDRLLLRRFTPADVDLVVALDRDPGVMRYISGEPPTTPEEARDEIIPAWLAYYDRSPSFGFWAAHEHPGGAFVGWFHFRPSPDRPDAGVELGYRLHRSAWGHGYATELSRALIHKGFTEWGVDRVYAETMSVNTASRRVMEKAGLRHVRTFHHPWPHPSPATTKATSSTP
ncbi:GNAT family N-acetyltransferase [Actinokineospora soli]|uniref:GNAT family N-acetyltransferase n=1 Tax=Actinokineospora soli TaxID=1048753 RepID=A0ABW2TMG0_9PSEU